jgi:cAMP-dependent protein kinase regulator
VKYEYGQKVIREGEVGSSFYIVESGKALAIKIDQNGKQKELYEYSEGEYFGELALISRGARKASVVAVGDLTVLELSGDTLSRMVGNLGDMLEKSKNRYAKYI